MNISQRILIFSFVLLIVSCKNNALEINTEKVDFTLNSMNFSSEFLTKNVLDIQKLNAYKKNYPEVFSYHFGYCYGTGITVDSVSNNKLELFYRSDYIQKVQKRCNEKFPDVTTQNKQIEEGFKHLKAHLPASKFPKNLLYINSNFASSAFCTKNEIVIGLERYLGAKTDVIQELPPSQFYDWIKEAMDSRYLERDAVCAWIITHIISPSEDQTNIEAIIEWGKIIYLTEAAFPTMEKSKIIRYSEKNYNWAIANEKNFWDFIVKQNLLFTKSQEDQRNLLAEGPFTAGLPQKAPDRLGQFLGWRIIQSYMEQNNVTVAEMVKIPYQEILQDYKINE